MDCYKTFFYDVLKIQVTNWVRVYSSLSKINRQ